MAIKKEGMERIGIRVPEDAKEWYVKESLSLGLTMSQYMSFVLVTHMRNQENAEAIRSLSEMSKSPDVQQANNELLSLLKSPEFKQSMKEYQAEIADFQAGRKKLP